MDNSKIQELDENLVTTATCSTCAETIYREENITKKSGTISYRKVQGVFMQFTSEDGTPIGPIWPYCKNCGEEPIHDQDVLKALDKLKGRANGIS